VKGRLLPFVIAGSSLTFFASLYLPWYVTRLSFYGGRFALYNNISGWGLPPGLTAPFSEVAGLLALALVAAALAAAVWPELANLPLGATAITFGAFVLLSASQLWTVRVQDSKLNYSSSEHAAVLLGLGADLGLAAAGIACVAAAVLRWRELARRPSAVTATGQALLLVLLVSFMLPALSVGSFPFRGPVTVFVCLAVCLALATWSREKQPGLRLANAGAIATLVAGSYVVSPQNPGSAWQRVSWVVVACVLALLVLALAAARSLRIAKLSVSDATTAFAAVLVLVSLFLSWAGKARGWDLGESSMAGGLVTLLLVGVVARRRVNGELAIGSALYVMSAWLAIVGGAYGPDSLQLRYGALLGFTGAGALLLAGLPTFRRITASRFLIRAIPIAACLAILSFAVAASTFRYDSTFVLHSPWVWLDFLGAAAILIGLRLLVRWTEGPPVSAEIVFLPLGLLAVTVLTLVYPVYLGGRRQALDHPITLEGWLSLSLCVLLAGCGWIAWKSGELEYEPVPA